MMRPLFCQPVFQFLNSMPAIVLLFPLLNTNQNLGTIPTSFVVADILGKHCYVLSYIENNADYQLIKWIYRTDHIIEFDKPISSFIK